MSINYAYEIVAVDRQSRCMEVVYTATGHPTQHIGVRLPYEGELLEDVIRNFAPLAYWADLKRNVVVPSVGTSGVINAADEIAAAIAKIEANNVFVKGE